MRSLFFPSGVPISKRVFDLVLTIPAILIFSLPLLIISAILLVTEGRPILFCQRRPGYRGHIFTVYKFRTMRVINDHLGKPLPDDQRISPLGHFLRSTSLDELPELFNILKGEMSLVGPRPLLAKYLKCYSPEQMRRHNVLPGITGWAQIHGRNILSWEEKFRYDIWYVDHYSFGLDIRILVMTIWKVLIREGISEPGSATATEFEGTPIAREQKAGEPHPY